MPQPETTGQDKTTSRKTIKREENRKKSISASGFLVPLDGRLGVIKMEKRKVLRTKAWSMEMAMRAKRKTATNLAMALATNQNPSS